MELRILLTGWLWGLRGKKELRMAAKFPVTVTDRTHNSETTHRKKKGFQRIHDPCNLRNLELGNRNN